MQKSLTRLFEVYLSGPIAPAAAVAALQVNSPVYAAALAGVAITSGAIWLQAIRPPGKRRPQPTRLLARTAQTIAYEDAPAGLWGRLLGRGHNATYSPHFVAPAASYTFLPGPGVPYISHEMPEEIFIKLAELTLQWERQHHGGQDIARNGKPRKAHEILSQKRYIDYGKNGGLFRFEASDVRDFKTIMTWGGMLHKYQPGSTHPGRLRSLRGAPMMLDRCRSAWEFWRDRQP